MLRNMFNPNFVLLYVDDPTASAAFYTAILGHAPIEASPTFAMFALPSGVLLGLWSKHTVEPAAPPSFGGSELAFTVDDNHAVRTKYAEWCARGLPIAQPPTDLDFGYTFVALDPDGHRLRVFAPGA
jgi:catechol 2,3-dioxygenase-like lactoylglutathione lyase family enzyme